MSATETSPPIELRDTLREIFDCTLDEFLRDEASNISNGVSEQNLCGRLAMILERNAHAAGLWLYRADAEYNRNFGGAIKTIINEKWEVVPIRCDLILHSRGAVVEKDNLIAVEMKRASHSADATQRDRERLRAMTRETYDNNWFPGSGQLPEHICGYELGYLLIVHQARRSIRVEEYADGEKSHAKRKAF
jgi:hypothetical protein